MIHYQSDGAVATIRLDDGKANVLSVSMLSQLNAALDRAETEKAVVLLTGREGMLSGGFDLAVFRQGKQPLIEMLKAGQQTAQRLLTFPTPTVIACTGHAVAMGVFLLLSVDFRLGIAQGPYRYTINEVQNGFTLPHFAVSLCRHRLTPASFNLATLTAEPHSPEQALAAGMLDQLVEESELLQRAQEKATNLSKLSPEAHRASKLRVRQPVLQELSQSIQTDLEEWERVLK